MKWFKFYGQDFLTDSKIGALNPLQRLLWVGLLCVASQDDERTGIIKFLTEDRLMSLCGLDYQDYDFYNMQQNVTLETFCNMGLVSMPDKNTIIINNFYKKQTQQSTSTERVRDWRAKNKDKIDTPHVTNETIVTLQSNGRVDKSRIDKKGEGESKYPSKYLKEIPGQDIKEFLLTYEVSEAQVKLMAEKILAYCESKGKTYKNYKAALRSWIMKDFKKRTDLSIKL